MKFLLFPEEIEGSSPVGGKARALAELTAAELPVPPWFVILPEAFDASLTLEQKRAIQCARSGEVMRSIVDEVSVSDSMAKQIQDCVVALGESGDLAVRSSALGEDSAAYSFAGQLESFLFVAPEHVAEYVTRVWRSGFGERLMVYRKEAGLSLPPRAPAVVVQRVVEGESSGVAFSADPVSGRRGIAVVAAVPGLASALVSGATNGDTWRIDRNGRVVEANIAIKQIVHRRDPKAPDGVTPIALCGGEATRPALQDEQAIQVAELARRAEKFFGRPQDIEWTLYRDRLFLLQSRPITGLAAKLDPDGARAIWDNSNIAESYGGVTTPLTFSFARRVYEHVYREFYRLLWIGRGRIEALNPLFTCMLGLVRGRVYYNLFNWYRLLALLPGYSANRRFLDEMLGVRKSPADETAASLGAPRALERLRRSLRLSLTAGRLILAYAGLNRRIRRFDRRIDDVLGASRPDLSLLRVEELTAYYRQLEQRLLTHWDAPVINDLATMISFGLLRRLAVKWLGEAHGTVQNDLLCGEHGLISEEPARRVRQMAEISAGSLPLVDLLCTGNMAAIRNEMRGQTDLARAFHDYLEKFGDRCTEELKLESATLFDDPLPLLRSIGQCARNVVDHGKTLQSDAEKVLRRKAEERVRKILARHPAKRAVFAAVLGATRAGVRNRENLRFQRTRVFGRARLIVVEVGKRLAALDCLNDQRDVFYLEIDELLAFVEGRATTTDLKALVALRKNQWDRYRSEAAPADRFETRGAVYIANRYEAESAYIAPAGESLRGIGCCPGIVRGRVRLVRDPRCASATKGEIIVAERTDPGWVMIFSAAAGLLVEHGSLLSHSAIVAREMGLPAIVSLAGLTRWLKEGDWIEMDGSSGVVTKIHPTV